MAQSMSRKMGNLLMQGKGKQKTFVPYSYILASHQMKVGDVVMNYDSSKPSKICSLRPAEDGHTEGGLNEGESSQLSASLPAMGFDMHEVNSKVGNCLPLADIRFGTLIHSIELRPGQGAKLIRAAGTSAKIIKEAGSKRLVRLASGFEKLIDARCRATIGTVSNPSHKTRKLKKAGNSRWRGRRPTVRGVAMNPVDHPHGGGEGKTSGGRPSCSPWGKPTKGGYKTVPKKRP